MRISLTELEKLEIHKEAIRDAQKFLECKTIEEQAEFVRWLSNSLRMESKSNLNRLESIINEKTL